MIIQETTEDYRWAWMIKTAMEKERWISVSNWQISQYDQT